MVEGTAPFDRPNTSQDTVSSDTHLLGDDSQDVQNCVKRKLKTNAAVCGHSVKLCEEEEEDTHQAR